MNVTVRFLLHFKDLAGMDEASVELPDGATVARMVRSLRESFPALFPAAERAMFMVNQKNVTLDMTLNDGDQITMMQIIGGG